MSLDQNHELVDVWIALALGQVEFEEQVDVELLLSGAATEVASAMLGSSHVVVEVMLKMNDDPSGSEKRWGPQTLAPV